MAQMTSTSLKTFLAASALAIVALPSAATAQIGGFETEITKEKKKAKAKKQDIVDVRLDPSWDGPRSVSAALKLVKENGEIVVHPGVYEPEHIRVSTSVSIRGIRDTYGKAPTLVADGNCVTVSKDSVAARLSDVTFRASDRTCINVRRGRLELASSEVRGRNASYAAYNTLGADHLSGFNPAAVTGSRSALVSVAGGRVSIENSKLVGGETGLMVSPSEDGNGFDHVSMRDSEVSQMSGAGVVLVGNVDADFAGNSIVSNRLGGLVYDASGHARIVGNIIANNGFNGLYIAGNGEAVSVERNAIHDNADDGIEIRSGIAILVGNDIGGHGGCAVNPNAFASGSADHTSRPPIQLLADAQGVTSYQPQDCRNDTSYEPRRTRRGLFSRGQ